MLFCGGGQGYEMYGAGISWTFGSKSKGSWGVSILFSRHLYSWNGNLTQYFTIANSRTN